MDAKCALKLIEEMQQYAAKAGVSLIIVGSVGYRSALEHHTELEHCDDIDCVFIYQDFNDLTACPYLNASYRTKVHGFIASNAADMFYTKITVYGIQISADFISRAYLQKLASEKIAGSDKFRIKATDAIEKDTNIYCNFWGEKICYKKRWTTKEGVQLYKLPIHLYINGRFYPGVLLNKFLYNPVLLCLASEDHDLLCKIQDLVQHECRQLVSGDGDHISVLNTAYKKDLFSLETKRFLNGWEY